MPAVLPAHRALATLGAIARRDRIELADALCTLDQTLARWERSNPGKCAQCGPGDCPGARAIGAHCPECKRVLVAEHCELDTLRNGQEIVRVKCPCGEITAINRN